MVSPGPPGPSYSPPRTAGSVAARRVGRALGPAAPMDGIAAAAGLAVGTLYRHFPTEEALLEAALADRIAEAEAAARAVIDRVAGEADPADQVDALVRWYAEVHLQDRAWKAAAAAAGLAADLDRGEARGAGRGRGAAAPRPVGRPHPGRPDHHRPHTLLLAGIPGPEVPADARARYLDVLLSGPRPR